MSDYGKAIEEFSRGMIAKRNAVVEEACERAIQGGKYGVLVEETFEGLTYTITATVHPAVPYGVIHEKRA